MHFLLGFFFIFLNACVFSADVVHGAGHAFEEEGRDTSSVVRYSVVYSGKKVERAMPGSQRRLLLENLEKFKGTPCKYPVLSGKYTFNKRRDLVKNVIHLRNNGHNIEHNPGASTLTLLAGKREEQKGCYREALWQRLCANASLLDRVDILLALDLSDDGYFVDATGVTAVKMLWRFMFQPDCKKRQDIFLRKKNAWGVILQDFNVYRPDYYRVHPDVQEKFSALDMSCFHKMFDFYKSYVEPQCTSVKRIAERLCSYITMSQKGVDLQEIQDFLQRDDQEKVEVWTGLGMLMRCGYGAHIRYDNGVLFWTATPEAQILPQGTLIENICEIFENDSSCDYITFALYKRGFFSVTPFDVRNILDVLIAEKRLRPGCDYVAGEVISGCDSHEGYLQEAREDLYHKIERGRFVDIMSYLKADIYPEHFGWKVKALAQAKDQAKAAEPVVLLNRKTMRNTGLSTPRVVRKKPCLDGGVDLSIFPIGDFGDEGCLEMSSDRLFALDTGAGSSQDYGQLVPLGGGYFCSESRDDSEEPLGQIRSYAQERQQKLLKHLQNIEGVCCSVQDLQALYGENDTHETILEDALSLMQDYHNIEYNKDLEQYRLCPGRQWPALRPDDPDESCMHAFCEQLKDQSFVTLNIREKTLHLYRHGYQCVPLSTVALLVTMGCTPSARRWGVRERRLVALKDIILQEEEIKPCGGYKRDLCGFGRVEREDLACVRKSLLLYTDGCSILKKDAQKDVDSQPFNQKGKTGDSIKHPEVFDALCRDRGQPCRVKDLIAVTRTDQKHRHREMLRTIADLRASGMNIAHYGDTFTLFDGQRVEKTGCYRRVAWHMLSRKDNNITPTIVGEIFMLVSDLGYNPSWSVIEHIFMLKKLCQADKRVPGNRVAAWHIIVAEGVLNDAAYYASRREGAIGLTSSDMQVLIFCWDLYNHIMYNQDPIVAHVAKNILKDNAEGISLTKLQVLLLEGARKNVRRRINALNSVSGLMRSGYAGQINLVGGLVIWQEDAPNVVPQKSTLFHDLCRAPLGGGVSTITVFLHKLGHLTVSPWDVTQLLDIMAFAGYREPSQQYALRGIWYDRASSTDFSYRNRIFIKRIAWLQGLGILERMFNGAYVDLETLLTTEEWIAEEEEGVSHV